MDIWVDRTKDNYQKIKKGFEEFGMSLFDMTEENFLNHPNWDVFTFGKAPVAIDLMVKVKGLNIDECYKRAVYSEDDDLIIKTIHKEDLLKAKKAAGRSKDINDLENL